MKQEDNNVHRLTPSGSPAPGGGNGNGHNLHGRVSALEARMDYLATKEDVKDIKIWALKGAVAGMVLAAAMSIGILKLFS